MGLAVAALALSAGPPARAQTLKLVCEGMHAQKGEIDYHPRLAHEGGPAAGNTPGLDPAPVTEVKRRIRVEINGTTGRVRLPAAMVHEDRDDWVALSGLAVDEDEITGHFSTGKFRSERLRIDRQSGEIQLRGASAFDGTCDKAPDTPPQRKF
jgi:hypothetical protein